MTAASGFDPGFLDLARVLPFKKASLQLIIEGKRILVGAFGFDKSGTHPWLLRPVEADPIVRAGARARQTGRIDRPGHTRHPGRVMTQHQIQALEIIRQFAETVATKLDPNQLLCAIVSAISQGLECTRCSIFLLEQAEGRDFLVCKAACQAHSSTVPSVPVLPGLIRNSCRPPCNTTFQSGEAVFIDDLEEDRRFDVAHEFYRDGRSMIVVPLKIAERERRRHRRAGVVPGWSAKDGRDRSATPGPWAAVRRG